jgi:predicted amidohydrolase
MEEYFRIGLIQTTLDEIVAWDENPALPIQMHLFEQYRIWDEVRKGFSNLMEVPIEERPHLIILPELTIPLDKEYELSQIAKETGSIIIAGLDFIEENNRIKNNAVVLIPENWPNQIYSNRVRKFYFGKTFFSYKEKHHFNSKGKEEYPCPNMHLLDAGNFGRIGVAICSDFFDIERFVIYKGVIHHMIVISYNQDIHSYYFLAEAIARLVYCNVIICNTGFFGGSLVFSPYINEFKRYLYKHEGGRLFTTQAIQLPVAQLDEAQAPGGNNGAIFKAQPPGYRQIVPRDIVIEHL